MQAAEVAAAEAERLLLAAEASCWVSERQQLANLAQLLHQLPGVLRHLMQHDSGLPERAVSLIAAEGCSSEPDHLQMHTERSQQQQDLGETRLHMESVQVPTQICCAETDAAVQAVQMTSGWPDEPSRAL